MTNAVQLLQVCIALCHKVH